MTTSEIFSTSIAFISLCVSVFTFYKALISKFKPLIIIRPRLILSSIGIRQVRKPLVIVGCDIINEGAKAGLIDDFELEISCINENTGQGLRYQLKPLAHTENYKFGKVYKNSDFDPFNGVFLGKDGKATMHILFGTAEGSFQLTEGDIFIKLKSRVNKSSKWNYETDRQSFHLSNDLISPWQNDGNTIFIDSTESKKIRTELLKAS